MIESAVLTHLRGQQTLTSLLTTYNSLPAVFSQNAPPDNATGWAAGAQYARVVFLVDMQGDPERVLGGTLTIDVSCKEGGAFPEDIEPVIRGLVHGWFFTVGTFTAAAQYKQSNYFTQPTEHISGVTMTFELLAFPVLTTAAPDVVARLNAWTDALAGIRVINSGTALPTPAWRPTVQDSAVYWRLVTEEPAGWIPDTWQTMWRTATMRGHVFAPDNGTAAKIARQIVQGLNTAGNLTASGDSPVRVDRDNRIDLGADPLRTGQITVPATFGVIMKFNTAGKLQHIYYPRGGD